MSTPYQDLLKDSSQSFEDGNYFILTITDLEPAKIYPLEFRWNYKDKRPNENWSSVRSLVVPGETQIVRPKFVTGDLEFFEGQLIVKWGGLNHNGVAYGTNLARIDVYVQYDDEAPLVFVKKASITSPNEKVSIPVIPGNYTVKLRAVTKLGQETGFSDGLSVLAEVPAPPAVTSVTPAWSSTNFTVTFNSDPSLAGNKYLSYFKIIITAGSTSKAFNVTPVSGAAQKFSISLAENRAIFGIPQTTFSGSITPVNIYGTEGTATNYGPSSYVNSLTPPAISVTSLTSGYSISYTTPTAAEYDHIDVEEVESNSGTAPTSGYATVFSGIANPAVVIAPNTNKRWIRARFYDDLGSPSNYSNYVSVTPISPVVVDNTGPAAPTGTVTGGLESSGTIGFNAFLDISWTAISDSTLRGYRIRFRPVTTPASNYSYVDSPGTGTTFRITGLASGTSYEVGIASYDEFNNTSSAYNTLTGSPVSTAGSPFIGTNVSTTGYFQAGVTGTDTGVFKFGYGVQDSGTAKRGLVLNTNNYWYIDSAQTASLKVGGSTTNYIQWNGSSFVIDGDLRAKKGSFSGNLSIANGASIYSGTLTGNTVTDTGDTGGTLSGAGFILNNSGLTFNSSTVNGITTINGTTGLLTTTSANIGGWNVGSSSISKTVSNATLTLDSASALISAIATNTNYRVALQAPTTNDPASIVLYAGSSTPASAPFRVRADGGVTMSSATITGYATDTALTNGLSGKVSTGGAASDVNAYTTTISGSKIRTGSIEGNNYAYSSGNFSTTGMQIDLTNNRIRSPQFAIDGGNAYFKGNITGASGTFSGTVSGGTVTATDGTNTLTISPTGAITNSSGKFGVTSAGILSAEGATINGNITATGFALSSTTGDYWSVTPGSTSTGFRFGGNNGISYAGSGNITLGSDVLFNGSLQGNVYRTASTSTFPRIEINGTYNRISFYTTQNTPTVTYYPGEIYPTTGVGDYGILNIYGPYRSGWEQPYIQLYSLGAGLSYIQMRADVLTNTGGLNLGAGINATVGTSYFNKLDIGSTVYANTLGTSSSGLNVVQVQSGTNAGFLKVLSSSRRFKENITPLSEAGYVDAIDLINPVTFTEKDNPESSPIIGLIAEELFEIPLMRNFVVNDNDEQPLGINYDRISVAIILMLKEIKSRLENVKQRLDALEG